MTKENDIREVLEELAKGHKRMLKKQGIKVSIDSLKLMKRLHTEPLSLLYDKMEKKYAESK